MQIGVLTDSLSKLTLDEALDHARDVGAATVEFGAGTWSLKPHIDPQALLGSKSARVELLQKVADRGLSISAINASGNQLHPDQSDADQITRDAVRLAGELGIDTVVLMSGLPAGVPGDRMPNWITTSWPPETTQMLDYQWNEVALPYWSEFASFAAVQGVSKLAVEMHANQLVYNVPSALHLRRNIGGNVGVNFDPSHLMWMGADSISALQALGEAGYSEPDGSGSVIKHMHAKDTRIESAAAVRSRLEYLTVDHPADRSWNYVTVGRGHDVEYWRRLIVALGAAGYDGPMSIEHEDAEVDGVQGVAEAAAVLCHALT